MFFGIIKEHFWDECTFPSEHILIQFPSMVGVLGFFKARLLPLSIMMLIGKFGRYFLLLYFYSTALG
jgi:membrane protein YqaA with SNARE-associated domain